jgi:7-cyano-7-deazaguanine synthase in queuosine biosynthesis
MMWHLIVTIGPTDLYAPNLSPSDARLLIPINHPTSPWYVGNDTEQVLVETLDANPHPVIRDLIRLAVAVYAADLRVPRKRTDDRWTRDLTLYLPVSNVSLWSKARPGLLRLLNFLTGDHWDVKFREADNPVTPASAATNPVDAVCLFSGGLDSLVGAIDLLAQGGRVALVSHHGLGDSTKSIQMRVVAALRQEFDDQIVHVPFYVHPDRGNTDEGDNTMRARSLLFMAMGIAVASVMETKPTLTVAENGLISLNVPLTGARTGSLSTRTTHPYYMELFRKLIASLKIGVPIDLPYRHLTKGEMLAQVKNKRTLDKTVSLTMSCSHPTVGRYAKTTPGNHCGYCVPCIIRLASLKAAGIADQEPDWDVVANPPSKSSDRVHDVRAFRIGVERLKGSDPRCDVFRILRSGPIPSDEARAFAAVYRRGMAEVARFLGIPFPL